MVTVICVECQRVIERIATGKNQVQAEIAAGVCHVCSRRLAAELAPSALAMRRHRTDA